MGRRAKDAEIEKLLKNQERRGLQKGSKEQVEELLARTLAMPADEINKYASDKRAPVLMSVTARGLLGKQGFKNMMAIIERVYGKTPERVDHTTAGLPIQQLLSYPPEVLDQLIKNLLNKDKEGGVEDA